MLTELNPHKDAQRIFDKDAGAVQQKKITVLSSNGVSRNDNSYAKKTTYICLYSDILKLDHRSKYKTGSCTVIRASHFAMPVSVQIDPFPIQLPAKMCLGRQQKDLAIGYLPATWETQIQFKAPALVRPSPIWRINYYMGVLFLHLSPLNTVVLLK